MNFFLCTLFWGIWNLNRGQTCAQRPRVKPFVANNEGPQRQQEGLPITGRGLVSHAAQKCNWIMKGSHNIEQTNQANYNPGNGQRAKSNGQDVSMSLSLINLPIVPAAFVCLCLWFYLWKRLVKRVSKSDQNILHVINQEQCYLVMVMVSALRCGDCIDKQTQFEPPTAGG